MMTVKQMLHYMHCGKQYPFRRFMEIALYSSDGYYNRHVKIGGDGADFYTAAQFPLFAYTIANAIQEAWKRFNSPKKLQVVEVGAGQGELASNLENRLKRILPGVQIQYVIVEKAHGLMSIQQNNLALDDEEAADFTFRRFWGKPDDSMDTVVIGNEVLDALPVERLQKATGGWNRGYVSIGSDGILYEVWRKAPAWLSNIADYYLPIPVMQISELCTCYKSFAKACKTYGKRVELLFADYGLYHSELVNGIRAIGTVRGYHRHQICEPFVEPGKIDITADVQWHIFQDALSRVGFQDITVVGQGAFLLAHDIIAVSAEIRNELLFPVNPLNDLKFTGQLKQLILPGGLGERFQVLHARI